jgi:hypothetical protein
MAHRKKKENEKFREKLIAYFPLIRREPYKELKVTGLGDKQQGDLISFFFFFKK